ncbi:serine/threonine protein kinase [Gemmata sp.]|uniref:serine/threonine protein kinase n=1 Tax=Gemmata sp. TaxID=1914242 RepID=UPI003F72BDF9
MASDAAPSQLGNYEIMSKIAEGGMGTVYKGRNRSTGETVAIKVIAAATAKNPVLLQRFEREFLAARVLDHPNVVRALDYCGTGPHPFLVMEFVDGESIGQRIERKGALGEAESVRLIAQVCEGLQRAHKQGLVHRDVKPDNIMITRDGTAKLTDLGLVKDVEGDLNLTKTGRGLGTPHYMAPEQFRNAKNVDVRGDIYSLGATLYAMVTGQVPFDNASPLDCWMKKVRNEFPTPRELTPSVSDRVDWAIRRAMSAEPDRRPASCREFLEDLTGQSRTAPPRPGAQPAPAATSDVWYLVYKDETNTTHTVKGNTESIRNALRDDLLGDPSLILVSRTKAGQFQPLSSMAEFRDLVVAPAALAGPTSATRIPPGSGPQSGTMRRADAGEPFDPMGQSGGGSRGSGRLPQMPPAGKSGPTSGAMRSTPAGSTRPTPTNPSPTRRGTPPPSDDGGPPFAPPKTNSRRTEGGKKGGSRAEKPPFDWTPVLLGLVLVLSAAVGYLVLTRR